MTVVSRGEKCACFLSTASPAVAPMASKEKKRVRWAATDDVFDDASIREAKLPRLSEQPDGPDLDQPGAVGNL